MAKKYDIVIVGAGAAGLTCAWRLSEKTGARIAVLEANEKVGRDITPGTLNMGFVNRLKGWGFSQAVEATYSALGLYCADESARFDLGGRPVGAAIDYRKFCQLLAKRSDADIFTGMRAEKIETAGGGIRINGEFEAKLLIDASGAALLYQKLTGARAPGKYFVARGAKCANCGVDDPSEISFILNSPYSTGGGWFYPLGRERASCGIAFLEDSPASGSGMPERAFRGMRGSFRPFSEYLKKSRAVSTESGIIPVEPLRGFADNRIMVVGDAAGQAFPLLGEGLRPTVESALMCSDVAAEACISDDFSLRRTKPYENEWNRLNRERYIREQAARDVAFGRTAGEWSDFTRRMRNFLPETAISFIGGDLRDKSLIRKKLPKREALKALIRYAYYKFFARW